MAAGLAAGGADAAAHGEGDGGAEGQGSAVGEQKIVVEVMNAGAVERGERVDGEQEDLGDAKDPEAEAESVATTVGEEQDERPEEIELLFDGERPEVIERKGVGGLEGGGGEVGKILKEEDKDGQRPELGEGGTVSIGKDCCSEEHGEVEREDAESSADVEVAQAVGEADGVPKAACDEKSGEGEEENDSEPAGLRDVAEEPDSGGGGPEAAAVVEDEDQENGEATEAVKCGVALGFRRRGDGGEGWSVLRWIDGRYVGRHWAQRS